MPLLPPVIVELRAQVDEFTAKLGEARGELTHMQQHGETFASKFGALGSAAFMAVGAAAVGLGTEALHLADAFETSHARLTASLTANGQSFNQWKSQIKAADDAGQKLGFTNAEVEDGLARLETMVKNPAVALKDLAVAEDVARARGIDLTTASNLVGKASEGTYTSLVKLGVVTKEQAANFTSGAEAVDYLGKAFGGQASGYADTFAGKLTVLKAQSENLGKNIGLFLIPIIEEVASTIGAGVQWVERNIDALKRWGTIIGAVVVPVLGLWAVAQTHVVVAGFIEFLGNGAASIRAFGAAASATAAELFVMAAAEVAAMGPIALAAAGLAGLYLVLTSGKNKWNDVTDAQKQWLKNIEEIIPANGDQVQSLLSVQRAVQGQADVLEESGFKAKGSAQQYDDLEKKIRLLDVAIKNAIKTQKAQIDAQKDAAAATETQAAGMGLYSDGVMEQAIADDSLKRRIDDATASAKLQAQALVDLAKRLRDTGTNAEDVTRAESDFQQKLDDGTKSIKDNKDSLDINTAAGRTNMTTVLDQIDSVRNLATANAKQGKGLDEVNGIVGNHINQLKIEWHNAGLNAQQIDNLTAQYDLVPDHIDTKVFADLNINTKQALDAFTALQGDTGALFALGGGVLPQAASGMLTRGPTIVGEGNPTYPEYVIPTDPQYRNNAKTLTSHMMNHLPGLASGGIVNLGSHVTKVDIDAEAAPLTTAERRGNAFMGNVTRAVDAVAARFAAQAAVGSGLGGPGYGSLTSWLGVPYLWGGGHNVSAAVARRTGVDCSGLVDQVYGQTGNTGTQFNIGTAVAGLGASLPGDLVFFGTQAAGEPHHVGIITNAGGSEMIDAPHTGTVVRYDRPSAFGSIQGIRRWPNGPVGQGTTGGAVDGWLEQAMAARGVGQDWLRGLEIIARYESNNSPSAVNRTDINAQMGTPSEGLMQVIQPTFDSYKMAGHNNIFNPVDNAIASIGYILARYGNINNVPGVRAVESGHPYVGYDSGGILPPGRTMVWNGTGRPERVVSPDGAGGGGVNVTVNVQGSLIGGSPDAIARALLEPIRKAYDVRGRSLVGGAYR